MFLRRSASESTSVKQSKQSTLHESVNALQPLSTSLLSLITHFHIAIQQYIASILCTISIWQICRMVTAPSATLHSMWTI